MENGITIVGLGEALWDVLPSGPVLGGAPLNAACCAHQLLQGSAGASPSQRHRRGQGVVASRVGTDRLGDDVISELEKRGMRADCVQRDAAHATSTVKIELQVGQPTFTFTPDIAWDHLEFTPAWAELAGRCTAVCFGTLAQRSARSRAAIWRFLDAAPQALRMFDVNLRQGFYDRESIVEGCRRATLLKLNEQELVVVADTFQIPPGPDDFQLRHLCTEQEFDAVIYTRGTRGTLVVIGDEVIDPPATEYPALANADAVGAGDACAAAVLVGWVLGLPPARTAQLANHLGAYVASQPGATPELPREIVELVGRS